MTAPTTTPEPFGADMIPETPMEWTTEPQNDEEALDQDSIHTLLEIDLRLIFGRRGRVQC